MNVQPIQRPQFTHNPYVGRIICSDSLSGDCKNQGCYYASRDDVIYKQMKSFKPNCRSYQQ